MVLVPINLHFFLMVPKANLLYFFCNVARDVVLLLTQFFPKGKTNSLPSSSALLSSM